MNKCSMIVFLIKQSFFLYFVLNQDVKRIVGRREKDGVEKKKSEKAKKPNHGFLFCAK